MTRVLIVDDHAVVRSGLRRILEAEDDIEVVGEAGNVHDVTFEVRSSSRVELVRYALEQRLLEE